MFKEFAQLETHAFKDNVGFRHTNRPAEIVDINAPALSVFTDFQMREPETTTKDTLASEALNHMKTSKVKSLLVVNSQEEVIGFVSSAFIQGVYLMQAAKNYDVKPAEATVNMIMIKIEKINMINYKDLSNARVGHIARLLHDKTYHHILAYDEEADGSIHIRGIFSRTRLNRLLGMNIGADFSVSSVADMNKYL
jgi:CBS-domain-containing membrane protein